MEAVAWNQERKTVSQTLSRQNSVKDLFQSVGHVAYGEDVEAVAGAMRP